jgi:hypothetical protein
MRTGFHGTREAQLGRGPGWTDTKLQEAETAALRALLTNRANCAFVSMADACLETDAMIAEKRAERRL